VVFSHAVIIIPVSNIDILVFEHLLEVSGFKLFKKERFCSIYSFNKYYFSVFYDINNVGKVELFEIECSNTESREYLIENYIEFIENIYKHIKFDVKIIYSIELSLSKDEWVEYFNSLEIKPEIIYMRENTPS
jgi:hypothetical protein